MKEEPTVGTRSPDVTSRLHAPVTEVLGAVDARANSPITYMPALDGLRGIAVLLVLVCHLLEPFRFGGLVGVDIFFVISGYLITTILSSEWKRTGRLAYRRFYLRRAIRLYPALLVTLILCLIPGLLAAPSPGNFGLESLATSAYLTPITQLVLGDQGPWENTWTLGLEEYFYLAWPLALATVLLARRARGFRFVAGAATLGLAAYVGKIGLVAEGHLFGSYLRAGGLLLGAALAVHMASRPIRQPPRTLALVGVVLMGAGVTAAGADPSSPIAPMGYLLAALGTVALIPAITSRADSVVKSCLSWRPLVYVGLISYELYLWNYPILIITRWATGKSPSQVWWWAGPLAVILAALTHEMLKPVNATLRRRIGLAGFSPAADAPGIAPAVPRPSESVARRTHGLSALSWATRSEAMSGPNWSPRSMTWFIGFAATCLAVALGWAAGTSHLLVAVLILLLVLLVAYLITVPWWPVLILGFAMTAVPKAGFQYGDFPVPVLLPTLFVGLLGITVRKLRSGTRSLQTHEGPPGFGLSGILLGAIVLWTLLRLSVLALTGAASSLYLPLSAWMLAPCVLLIAFPIGSIREQAQWASALDYGYLFAAGFAFVQQIFGTQSLVVPGVTIAYGADYLTKNNNLTNALGSETQISKIPSTYQSGNVFGLASAFFFALSALRIARREATVRDYVITASSFGCVLISGSRTALIACVVFGVCVSLIGTSIRVKIVTASIFGGGYIGLQVLLPGLAPRYSLSAILTSGGAGRVSQWREALQTFPLHTWAFGDFSPGLGTLSNLAYEGWVGVLQQIGLLGVGLAVMLVAVVTRRRRSWRLVLLVIAVGSLLDSSYIVFPTLFLPAARMLAMLSPARSAPATPNERQASLDRAVAVGGTRRPALATDASRPRLDQ